MNSIQPVIFRSPYGAPASKALVSVQPAQRTDNADREAESGRARSLSVDRQLQTRAQLLGRQQRTDQGLPPRGRQAIDAYRTLEVGSERDRLSSLLGIDEYA